MIKGLHNKWQTEDGHPSDDDLLLLVDGELAPKESGDVRAHLEACWSCRVRTEKIQEAITSFIDYRNNVLKPLVEPPPSGWRGFDGKLSRLVAESCHRSRVSQMRDSLGRLLSMQRQRLRVSPRLMLRVAAGLLVACIVVALALLSDREATVSASELLQNATEAQATQLRVTAQPVIYQKLQVQSKDHASARENSISWEIWNDSTRPRLRQSVTDESGRRFLTLTATSESGREKVSTLPAVLVELEQVLRVNSMDPQRPLSPTSYQAWRNTIAQRQEHVTKSRLPNGDEVLTLRIVPAGRVEVGRITEAVLVVRVRDWHPDELRLRVRAEKGDREYELTEAAFEVVSLTALSPEIFPEQPGLQVAAPTPGMPPSPSPSLSLSTNPVPLTAPPPNVPPARAFATAELEVEVLQLLNQAGADLGEQVSAERTPDGLLRVEGVVETDERKAEILRELKPVINHPAVRIGIRTVAEAVAEQSRTTMVPGIKTEQKVEITSGSIATESELRGYFAGEGERADEAVRQYAARMVSRSRQAMRHLYALKRLSAQFSSEELRTLSPEARSRWLALVRSHARAYASEAAGLRQELRPVFFPSVPPMSAPGGMEISDTAMAASAIERLFDLGSANDRVIRAAFTTSPERATVTAIRTPQFWQSLRNAEVLASRIESAK